MSTYQPNIPTGIVNLDVDYKNLQGNFQQLDTTFGVDHLKFSNQTAQNGYHTAIHLVPVSTPTTNPTNNQPINGYTATPGYGQIFSAQIIDGINNDEALYFLTGGNRLLQLTRNFVPVSGANGYTFLPGGFIMQWGVINSGTSGNTSFNIAFPGSCFGVWAQPRFIGNAPNSGAEVAIRLNGNINFIWSFFTNSGSYNGFFWWALGI